MLTFAESGHPVFRSTSPLSKRVLKCNDGGKLSIHYCVHFETIDILFHTIISVNQFSLYGTIADMCEEYESCHDRTGEPVVGNNLVHRSCQLWSRQTYFWMMIFAHGEFLLQRYWERIEKLSQQERLSKFCMDAGFLSVVENGQYFMTKDTADLSQFHPLTCRENTFPRDEDSSEPKSWIRGNTRIGPVLEVTTCCLQGKYGNEIRIKSVNKTLLTRGSGFLMAQTTWSRIWTTTSRKPQKCSSKIMR